MKPVKLHQVLVFATLFVGVLGCLAAQVSAQTAEIPRHTEPYSWGSGSHDGYGPPESSPGLATQELVWIPGAPWLQLRFREGRLGGQSYVEITSLQDGATQRLDAEALRQWNNHSAYFNGDAVEVRLFVGPQDRGISISIPEVVVGEWAPPSKSICGTDDRVASNEGRVARIDPIGCTGWIIDGGQLLTAGHCLAGGSTNQTLSFNVPPSLYNGTVQFPGPEDQYSINQSSFEYSNNGIGNDWGIFAVFDNSQTGLQPIEAQGSFSVKQDLGPSSIRITGFGIDSGATNQTNQTQVGPNAGSSGTTMRYVTDTQGGNSGSPIIDEATGLAVGIHTNGGCETNGYNSGTSFFNSVLWNALDMPSPGSPDVVVTRVSNGVVVGEGSTVDFGTVNRGVAITKRFKITNTGQATLTISNPTSFVSGTCWSQVENAASTVAPGASTYFQVRFLCNSTGTKTGTVHIVSDDPTSSYDFNVRATVISDVAVSQAWDGAKVGAGTTVSFGTVETGVAISRRFQITNTGQTTLTISNPTSFVSGTCWYQIESADSTVAPGASTYFRVRFLCNSTGTKTGVVTIHTSDPDSPFVFYVRCTAVAADVAVSQAWDGAAVGAGSTESFGTVETGVATSRRFKITNTGQTTLTINNPTSFVSGTCWSQIENASSTLAPGASTYFRVRLLCGSTGTKTGTVTIQSNDPSSPYVFYVQGTVTAPALGDVTVYRAWNGVVQSEGSTFPFPDTTTGSSVSRRFRITNNGPGTLTISNPTSLVSGTCWSQIENASSTVAPGASTYFRVRLLCNTTGTKNGTITIHSNDPTSPYVFYVQGTVN